jgi:mxaA protein
MTSGVRPLHDGRMNLPVGTFRERPCARPVALATRRWVALVTMLAFTLPIGPAHAAPEVLTASTSDPRAFGYTVGDVVSRRIALHVPAGLRLDENSLPRIGARGKALELQRVALHRSLSGVPETLLLEYQVFLAPREVRVLEMPPVELRFEGTPRAQTLRVDAWPVTVAPLAPVDPSPREGLGELRPDREPPAIDTAAARARLVLEALLAALLMIYLAAVYLGVPWLARRRRPFGMAWKNVRSLPDAPDASARRAAFEHLHAALNQTAGAVVFEAGLARFLVAQPRFAELHEDLRAFFAQSREEFFGSGAPTDARWLVEFARRCRDAERGAA